MNYPTISWKENTLEQDLTMLSDYAIVTAEESNQYYRDKCAGKRIKAKFLRVIAIVAGALGGLIPIVSQMYAVVNPGWATVAISITLAALALDRFFGYSSAWMRFITTTIKLDAKILEFRMNIENEKFSWSGNAPTFDKAKSYLLLIVNFLKDVSEIVQDETNSWMVEFQNVLQKFNEEMNVKSDPNKLGGIKVTVENGAKYNDGLVLHLEGQQPVSFNGSSYSFSNLFPKIYRLSVSGSYIEEFAGTKMKRQAQDATLVNVTSGAIVDVALKLK